MHHTSWRARMGTTLGLALILVACSRPSDGPKAHAFTLETPTGAHVTVDPAVDKRGKVLIFWASW